jgi:hypothetical protein
MGVRTIERHTDLEDWLRLIRGEYLEMPGLQLTKRQMQRMWGIDELTCDALVDTLQRSRFLRVTSTGGYVLEEGAPYRHRNPRMDQRAG